MHLPPPVKSFLKQYSFKNKTVVPFNTHAGYGEGDSFATFKELCPESTVAEGLAIKGGIERDGIMLTIKDARAQEVRNIVSVWLKRIKIVRA